MIRMSIYHARGNNTIQCLSLDACHIIIGIEPRLLQRFEEAGLSHS